MFCQAATYGRLSSDRLVTARRASGGVGDAGANPFPDATPAFVAAFQRVVNEAIGGEVRVERPYAGLAKTDVRSVAATCHWN